MLLLVACTPAPDADATIFQLQRASMALRGTRPSLADYERVESDPDAFDDVVATYTSGPDFGATIRDLHAADFLLRSEGHHLPAAGILADTDELALVQSVEEEPVRTIEWLVQNDHPYTEIVSTEVVLADATVASAWGLARDPALPADEWVPTHWPDDRPAAGILVSAGLWFRHDSNGDNQNRGRANRVTRALVCQDFLVPDLPFDSLDLEDARDVADAVHTAPQCLACHADLDPIASYFYGFLDMPDNGSVTSGCADGTGCYPLASWRPDHTGDWASLGMPAPAWFGQPGTDLADLGRSIAADPRFSTCAARRFAGWLRHVSASEIPASEADSLAEGFVSGGYDAKALARAAVAEPAFRDAAPLPIRPEQLSRLYADLTGWRWEDEAGVDLLTSDREGWRSLAGGGDNYYVTRPDEVLTPTKAVVVARAAELAAASVVTSDLAEPDRSARRLLDRVDANTVDEDSVRTQLATLHLRILGERVAADSPEVDETWDLFRAAEADGGAAHAWRVVLAAMLQDPGVLWY